MKLSLVFLLTAGGIALQFSRASGRVVVTSDNESGVDDFSSACGTHVNKGLWKRIEPVPPRGGGGFRAPPPEEGGPSGSRTGGFGDPSGSSSGGDGGTFGGNGPPPVDPADVPPRPAAPGPGGPAIAPPPPPAAYARPASYDRNGLMRNDIIGLPADARTRMLPETDHNYAATIQQGGYALDDNRPLVALFQQTELERGQPKFHLRDNLATVLDNEATLRPGPGADGNEVSWKPYFVYANTVDRDSGTAPMSRTYSNGRFLVVGDSYADEANTAQQTFHRIYHSDIFAASWENANPGNGPALEAIVRANINNPVTLETIADARKAIGKDTGPAAKDPVEYSITSGNIAERDAFTALANTENGKQAFRMLADRHNTFGNRDILTVREYPDSHKFGPNSDSLGPALVWLVGP